MRTIVLIPARLASTRLPNKPLADIHGVPMIVHVWRRAMAAGVGDVAVACAEDAVRQAIEREGGRAVLTDPEHPSGSDRIFEALGTLDPRKNYETVVNLQGDLPTLDPVLVRETLVPLEQSNVDIATLAAEVSLDEARRPDVVKPVIAFESARQGRALYFTRALAPYGEGRYYHHIGIYAYRRAALERFVTLPPSVLETREKLEQLRALEAGMRIDVRIVDTVPLGVDTAEDLETARRILKGTP